MLDIDRILLRLLFLLREEHRDRALDVGRRVVDVFTGYLRGLFTVCAGYAAVNGLILALFFHLPYSLMIGLLAGILYAVPYIGAVATIALGVLVALSSPGHSMGYVIGVGLTLVATNQIFDQIITPRIVGGEVGLHPVLSIFALTVAGDLFGLTGMILAVPVAASIRVVLIELFPALARPIPGQRGEQPRKKRSFWRWRARRIVAAEPDPDSPPTSDRESIPPDPNLP
jgi:predicted PurR-regulated permease PerM